MKNSLPEVDDLVTVARQMSERGLHAEAAELLRVAHHLRPEDLNIKLSLARANRLIRHQESPTDQPTERSSLDEDFRRRTIDAAHFLGLAQLYADRNLYARALECLDIAKAKDPGNPTPYKLLGEILSRRNDFEGAARELAKSLRFNPFDREVAESLGRVQYERKQFAEALTASVDAYMLLRDGDSDAADRLTRRIRTLKRILDWDNRQLVRLFHERREVQATAFDRLQWRREQFLEKEGLLERGVFLASSPPTQKAGGRIALAGRLRQMKLWSHFSDEQIFELTQAVEEEYREPGSVVFSGSSGGIDLYCLERGEVVIQRSTHYGTVALRVFRTGDLFGEINFLTPSQRVGEAVATHPSFLLRIDGERLERRIREAPELGVQIYSAFWQSLTRKLRITSEHLTAIFATDSGVEDPTRRESRAESTANDVLVDSEAKIRLFREQGLSRKELLTLATFSKEKHFPDGAYLFHEGEEGDVMYVILEGRARVSKFIPGSGEEALTILERGDFFGEMSLVDGEPRSADARAHGGPVTVLALDRSTVREVLSMDPQASLEFLQLLCRLLAKRLRELDEKIIGLRIISGQAGRNSWQAGSKSER